MCLSTFLVDKPVLHTSRVSPQKEDEAGKLSFINTIGIPYKLKNIIVVDVICESAICMKCTSL